MDVTEITYDEWTDHLPETGFDPFHTREALEVIDRYADGDVRLFVGKRGEQLIGLFPLFVRDEGPLTFVMSPPPGLAVPRLGPILMSTSPKQRKREKTNQRFTEAVLERIDASDPLTAFGMVSTPEYTDPRPYSWNGLSVDARFTYAIDLAERKADDVLNAFTSDLRSEIRKRDELDIDITIEGGNAARQVCADMKERHAEQGLSYSTPPSFSEDLVDSTDDRSRVYVARTPDGSYLSGITILYSTDEAIFWQGGAKANYQNVSVNSLLHWRIIEDILDDPELESVERYDLGNAGVERISDYKSKFDARLRPHYEVKSNLMLLAKKAYSAQRHLQGTDLSDIKTGVRQRYNGVSEKRPETLSRFRS